MVMGDDNSCSKGRGFESRRLMVDGHFFTLICLKQNCWLEKTKNKRKRGRDGPFKKNLSTVCKQSYWHPVWPYHKAIVRSKTMSSLSSMAPVILLF